MKRIFALALCAVLLFSLLGCTKVEEPYTPTGDALDQENPGPQEPERSQPLVMIYDPEKPLNPFQATDYNNRALLPLVYQGLFAVDREYNVVPILCQRYQISSDMRTYTIYPAAATFSDGTTLTCEDIVASLAAAKASAYYSGRFTHIRSFVVEEDAVVIKTDTPYENLMLLLDIPIVKATDVALPQPLGTGPFTWGESLNGKCLKRNTFWWCTGDLAVTADLIPLVEGTSPSQIRDSFEYSNVSLVCTDPGSDTYADYRKDREIWHSENGLFVYLVTHADSKVFSNSTLRSALTHAIDRDALVNEHYRGFAYSATLPASPLSLAYNASLAERYGYDSAKFAQAVADSGKTGAEVVLILNADDSLRLRVGRQIGKMLEAGGLKVKIEELRTSAFVKRLKSGNYDLYLAQTKLSPNMDLSPFFAQKGSLNYGGLADTATYYLCMESLANSGNFYNLHETVMTNGRLCPILFRSYAVYTTRGLVADLPASRDNLFFYTLGRTLSDALINE